MEEARNKEVEMMESGEDGKRTPGAPRGCVLGRCAV